MDGSLIKSRGLELLPVSGDIWNEKYRFKNQDGSPIDLTVQDTFRRVANGLASVETDPAHWADKFFSVMDDRLFIPAGRILAGTGTARRATLFNCFVMGNIEDDLKSIFEHLKEAGLTMQQGGGIGYNFSTIRPKGSPVKGVGADASGPLSFMDMWDSMCATIKSAGNRRGAMMGMLNCDHPDIEDFIVAKQTAGRLKNFNMSVLVTDDFMTAVKANTSWDLKFNGIVHRTVGARDLWNKIMQSTYNAAEPGVIFIERMNRRNNLNYCEVITGTNPCGEVCLPEYGTCLLGSVNLAMLVDNEFTSQAEIDQDRLGEVTRLGVRMLDNVIDVSNYPLEQHREQAVMKRRLGLGITGLADALIMCGVKYGTPEAVSLTRKWMKEIRKQGYLASADLAEEKGSFPLFDCEQFLATENVRTFEPEVREAIAKKGLRNGLVTSIAPTGTISLFTNNVSSGLEPVFQFAYDRNITNPDQTMRTEEVSDYAYRLFKAKFGADAPLTEAFVTTDDLIPAQHVAMQAVVQEYVDASISKTVNVPKDIKFDDFKDVYMLAYDSGCKGITTYRPNDITGSILVKKEDAPAPTEEAVVEKSSEVAPMARPVELPGVTYKLRWPTDDTAIYVTLNDIVVDGARRPFEIFINSKKMGHFQWTVGLTRMISAVFRRGGDVTFVVEELKSVFDPTGGAWIDGEYVNSLVADIGHAIERHMKAIGFLKSEQDVLAETTTSVVVEAVHHAEHKHKGERCERCEQYTVVVQNGCSVCTSCLTSKCG